MKSVIVFGSHYGTTKSYAKKLSEMTGILAVNYKELKGLSGYELVIHMGGLYAGGVIGLKHTVKELPENARFIIVTVGVADVNDRRNTDNIKQSISKQIPKDIYDRASIFHLRGGIDYEKLSFVHKGMMTLVYNKAKNVPEAERDEETKALIETFNKKVDFVDYKTLDQIIEVIS